MFEFRTVKALAAEIIILIVERSDEFGTDLIEKLSYSFYYYYYLLSIQYLSIISQIILLIYECF